jgi:hypothetical protein
LGREIYDGDDMLDATPSSGSRWPLKRQNRTSPDEKSGSVGGLGGIGAFTSAHTGRINDLAHRLGRRMTESPRTQARQKRTIHIPAPAPVLRRSESANHGDRNSRSYMRVQTPPPVPVISSPISRTETVSADSTVYTVRYHPISDTPPVPLPGAAEHRGNRGDVPAEARVNNAENQNDLAQLEDLEKGGDQNAKASASKSKWYWQAVANSFRRPGRTPPQELLRGRVIEPLEVDDVAANIPPRNYTGLALADRLGTFAAQQGERFRAKKHAGAQAEATLPVTIIPAQPRGQTWSPDIAVQKQLAQKDDTLTPAGFHLIRVPTAIAEEEDVFTPPQSAGAANLSEAAYTSSSPIGSTNGSRNRFSPNGLSRAEQQGHQTGAAISRHASMGRLENQTPGPRLHDSPSTSAANGLSQHHTSTNHDR